MNKKIVDAINTGFQVVIGVTLGILLGMTIDFIMPTPNEDDSIWSIIFLLLLQLFISGIVVWVVLLTFPIFHNAGRKGVIGYLLFTVTLFLTQSDISKRVYILKYILYNWVHDGNK